MSDKLNANELLTYSFVSRDLQEKERNFTFFFFFILVYLSNSSLIL